MKTPLFCLVLMYVTLSCGGQVKSGNANNLKCQADTMCQLLVRKDFSGFIKYSHPKIVEMNGGESKFILTLESVTSEMESQGNTFINAEVGDPSQIVHLGDELQAIIPKIVKIKTSTGVIIHKSVLIAFSNNSGKDWQFIETNGKDISCFKSYLPPISEKLSFELEKSDGYDDIKKLYKESIEVIKTKDKSKMKVFISKILPDKGTIDYMNNNDCEYRGIPECFNQRKKLLDSLTLALTDRLYRYSLKLEQSKKLVNLKFEQLKENEIGKIKLNTIECPDFFFTETYVVCSSDRAEIIYSFGELIKINGKWKSFTDFKL